MLYCFGGRLGHLVIPIWITCAKATSRRKVRRYLSKILFHLNRYASTTGCQPTRPQMMENKYQVLASCAHAGLF